MIRISRAGTSHVELADGPALKRTQSRVELQRGEARAALHGVRIRRLAAYAPGFSRGIRHRTNDALQRRHIPTLQHSFK